MEAYLTQLSALAVDFGGKLLGAIALWFIGKWLIRLAHRLLAASLKRQTVDDTLARYIGSTTDVLLNIILVIAVLGVFGVETTTFAGLLAAAGVAIGMAWSGLLSNLAAGVFMVLLRPIHVGDFVTIGGITGTVREIGMFVTAVDTPDNVRVYIGNNKIFSGDIINFSTNPYRRVELECQLPNGVSIDDAIARLKVRVAQVPYITQDPKPDVEVLRFTLAGPVLAVRPYVHTDHYWDVYFATNVAIAEVAGAAGWPVPNIHQTHLVKHAA
jgi:small conductance mechanosensitive channel